MMDRLPAIFQTLQAKVLLALLLVGMIPIGLVGLGVGYYYHEALVDESSRELTGLARGLAGTLDVHLSGLLSDSQAIAIQTAAAGDASRQEQVLKDLFHAYPAFTRLSVFSTTGERLASSSSGGASVGEHGAFREAALRGQQSWEIRDASASGRRSLVIYTPLRDANRRTTAVLGSVVDLENLSSVVGRVPVGGGGDAFVLDGDQAVLLHPNRTTLQAHPDYSFIGLASGGPAAGPNTARFQVDGRWFIAGYARVPNVGWTVVVERPEAEVLAPAEQAWNLARLGLLSSMLLASLAAVVLARRLTRPLYGLARAAQGVGAGDTAVPLPATSDRELGMLITSFADMRSRLEARTTEQERAEAALRFLAGASQSLATSLDFEITLNKVARLAVPFLADFCLVDMVMEDGSIRRVAAAHADPAKESLVQSLLAYPPTAAGASTIPRVLRTGEAGLTTQMPPDYLTQIAHDEEHRRLIEALRPASSMVVPLRARGRTLGAISFIAAESGRQYTASDLALAEDLAHRCAVAVDNARLYQEVQAAVQARDTFLSIASHELKTPVTIIKGYSQMLLHQQARGQIAPERLARLFQTIDQASNRLTGLTNDLLDVSRIQLGQMPVRPQRLDLVALTRQIAANYEPQLGEQHHLVIATPSEPCLAMVDPERLEQVLTNLLENAAKYSPEGGTIRLAVEIRGDEAVISVRDEGIGLPAGHQESLFQPFGRAPNATNRQLPGLGLGLYICRTIIEQHGGSMAVRSDGENQGTTAEVRLPLAIADAVATVAKPPAVEEATAEVAATDSASIQPAG